MEFPVDAEDYATRPAVVDYVGEGAEFAYDGCGNYYTRYTRDGSDVYYVAERNAARVNAIVFYCPRGPARQLLPRRVDLHGGALRRPFGGAHGL